MFTTFRRIFSAGSQSFARSGLVSFATVLIMTATLIIIGTLILLSAVLSNTLAAIENKVDINVYFTTDAGESDIMSVKSSLEKLPAVAQVTYTSREDALAQFRARHSDDQLTLAALDQLGENPLGASLAVKATDPSKYASIVNFLSDGSNISGGSSIIERVNYYQNKTVIDRLTAAISATQKAGLAIVLLFAIASIIIAFATVRLAIYSARDEIAVMRLVGASNAFIRGPFIVAGIIGGVISAVITLLLFYPATWYAGRSLSDWLGGFNLFTYYTGHFAFIFFVLVGSGVLLGGIASFVAVRRYLRI
ncbi:MAG: permease-like cell division protein FtsX [Patescibacteria group bacterium]